MVKIERQKLTKEMIEKALKCKDADELMKAAKAEGYELTKNEAEAYMEELADMELDEETLEKAAGGKLYNGCKQDNWGLIQGG